MGETLERRVEDVCLEEGIAIRKVPNEMAHFHLTLQFPNPQSNINVFQPKGKKDMILIGAVIEVSESHKQRLLALENKKREEFIWNLRMLLAQGYTEFELQHPENVLEFVRIHKFLFEDGFSKNAFMNSLLDVNRCKLLVVWFIQRELGVPLSHMPAGEDTIMYR